MSAVDLAATGTITTELTIPEALAFARLAVKHGAPSAPAMRVLLRIAEQLERMRLPNDTMVTLRAFAASAKAHREFPRTVDAVELVIERQPT